MLSYANMYRSMGPAGPLPGEEKKKTKEMNGNGRNENEEGREKNKISVESWRLAFLEEGNLKPGTRTKLQRQGRPGNGDTRFFISSDGLPGSDRGGKFGLRKQEAIAGVINEENFDDASRKQLLG